MKYWKETTDYSAFRTATTIVDAPPPATTAHPNSLGELMRNTILLPGKAFPYNPSSDFFEARRQIHNDPRIGVSLPFLKKNL